MLLTDACAIYSGYTARSRLDAADQGGVLAIQLRDFSPSGDLDPSGLLRVDLADLSNRYFVHAGDVLFRSRGDNNTALALDERWIEPAVAVLPLMILRPKREIVTPEYLAWVINQPESRRYFDSKARGTSIRMVPKSSLDELRVDIPNLEMQRQITAIDSLAKREKALSLKLAEKRENFTNRMLAKRAKFASRIAPPKGKTK